MFSNNVCVCAQIRLDLYTNGFEFDFNLSPWLIVINFVNPKTNKNGDIKIFDKNLNINVQKIYIKYFKKIIKIQNNNWNINNKNNNKRVLFFLPLIFDLKKRDKFSDKI